MIISILNIEYVVKVINYHVLGIIKYFKEFYFVLEHQEKEKRGLQYN